MRITTLLRFAVLVAVGALHLGTASAVELKTQKQRQNFANQIRNYIKNKDWQAAADGIKEFEKKPELQRFVTDLNQEFAQAYVTPAKTLPYDEAMLKTKQGRVQASNAVKTALNAGEFDKALSGINKLPKDFHRELYSAFVIAVVAAEKLEPAKEEAPPAAPPVPAKVEEEIPSPVEPAAPAPPPPGVTIPEGTAPPEAPPIGALPPAEIPKPAEAPKPGPAVPTKEALAAAIEKQEQEKKRAPQKYFAHLLVPTDVDKKDPSYQKLYKEKEAEIEKMKISSDSLDALYAIFKRADSLAKTGASRGIQKERDTKYYLQTASGMQADNIDKEISLLLENPSDLVPLLTAIEKELGKKPPEPGIMQAIFRTIPLEDKEHLGRLNVTRDLLRLFKGEDLAQEPEAADEEEWETDVDGEEVDPFAQMTGTETEPPFGPALEEAEPEPEEDPFSDIKELFEPEKTSPFES